MAVAASKPPRPPITHHCNALVVWEWKHESKTWMPRIKPSEKYLKTAQVEEALAFRDSNAMIVLANADGIRGCPTCLAAFCNAFKMPKLWWRNYCRNSNGYFGSRKTVDEDQKESTISTWFRFLVKEVLPGGKYKWLKLNIYTHWRSSTTQSAAILIFDAPLEITSRFPSPALDGLTAKEVEDPFWFHPYLVEELVDLQDHAVWGARTQIRTVELGRTPTSKPTPDYVMLHELARHTIHVSETLDLAINTAGEMLHQHAEAESTSDAAAYHDIHERLQFFRQMLKSLRLRSMSNTERLKNEVQLAFNTVAQYDAGLSLQINRAAKSDSAAMRTLAFITAAFLPATLISAVFSMSFFNLDDDGNWKVSGKIWLYWAVATPATVVTMGLWHYWQRKEKKLSGM